MCDYSLQHVQSRPARVADRLVVHNFGTGTRGFCSPDDRSTAVCLIPGTELAFERPIVANVPTEAHQTAIFRQIDKTVPYRHHDALELPGGQILLLTQLGEGQVATVLQLPAQPKTPEEAVEQTRAVFAG
jgi:hypothetical protein